MMGRIIILNRTRGRCPYYINLTMSTPGQLTCYELHRRRRPEWSSAAMAPGNCKIDRLSYQYVSLGWNLPNAYPRRSATDRVVPLQDAENTHSFVRSDKTRGNSNELAGLSGIHGPVV